MPRLHDGHRRSLVPRDSSAAEIAEMARRVIGELASAGASRAHAGHELQRRSARRAPFGRFEAHEVKGNDMAGDMDESAAGWPRQQLRRDFTPIPGRP